jgi:fused signal recognition particle receptor
MPCEQPLVIPETPRPWVILVVGVNGAGKTTTIGKVARRLRGEGLSVLIAAGDTFRAAAVEQLQAWGARNDVPVIAQQPGADPAAVVFDAVQSAQARHIDVVIADTAGRLHTQENLMDELRKVKRVVGKLDAEAPHEILLVLDGSTGQNALIQARRFNEAVGVTGVAITKLDGSAKGGSLVAVAKELKTPIRYIGIGEGLDDLDTFAAAPYVDALMEGAGTETP